MDDQLRAALRRLVAARGEGAYDDPRRTEALLRDHSPGSRAGVHVLAAAARARVPQQLLQSAGGEPPAMRLARLARELERECAIAPDAARWAVESWAMALGVPVPAAPAAAPPPAVSPPTSPPLAPAPPAPPAAREHATRDHAAREHAAREPVAREPEPASKPRSLFERAAASPPMPTSVLRHRAAYDERPAAAPLAASAAPASAPALPPATAPRGKAVRWLAAAGAFVGLVLAAGALAGDDEGGGGGTYAPAAPAAPETPTPAGTIAPLGIAYDSVRRTTGLDSDDPPPAAGDDAGALAAGGWAVDWTAPDTRHRHHGLLTVQPGGAATFTVTVYLDDGSTVQVQQRMRRSGGSAPAFAADEAVVASYAPPSFSYAPDLVRLAPGEGGVLAPDQVCDVSGGRCAPARATFLGDITR